MADITITQNAEAARFEAHLDGTLAGFAEYQLANALIVFTHTEVDPAFEGQGVGSALARAALDAVRADGTRKVLPLCPFMNAWLSKHPEYRDLAYGN